MKLAIHNSPSGFHPYWISYCQEQGLPHKIVNCYASNIIEELADCDALLFHHAQTNPRDVLFAKQLLFSVEQAGVPVFPNFKTAWHFDDKVGQKYLLEKMGIPMVPSYVFYSKEEALQWVAETTFPKVFKLRGGAGSDHVSLAGTRKEAEKLVRQAFGRGFRQYDPLSNFKERIRKYSNGSGSVKDLAKGAARFVYPPKYDKVMGREVGYAYFQDFIPDNDSDIRVIIIANRAFAIKRMVRDNDFRASGSGDVRYEKENFSDDIIKLSFEINKKVGSQSLAIDYVLDNGQPKVVELSYGFIKKVYDPCQGYWDEHMNYHPGKIDPMGWIIESLVNVICYREESQRLSREGTQSKANAN